MRHIVCLGLSKLHQLYSPMHFEGFRATPSDSRENERFYEKNPSVEGSDNRARILVLCVGNSGIAGGTLASGVVGESEFGAVVGGPRGGSG